MVYILGSDKTLQLEVEVHNKGESAYSTQLHVKIPKPVDLESIPSSCQQDDDAGEYNIAITCFVANPLYNDKRVSNILYFIHIGYLNECESIIIYNICSISSLFLWI